MDTIEPSRRDCCNSPSVANISATIDLRYQRFEPRVRPDRFCVECGWFSKDPGLVFSKKTLAKLRALYHIAAGSKGSAKIFRLEDLRDLVKDLPNAIIETKSAVRIDDSLDLVKKDHASMRRLRSEITNKLGLMSDLRPKAIPTAHLGHPTILHHGLPLKYTTDDHTDAGHVRFVGYTRAALLNPLEVWRDTDGDGGSVREIFRSISALRVATSNSIHFMHAVVEADSHILTTAYVVDRATRIEQYRTGMLLKAVWAEA